MKPDKNSLFDNIIANLPEKSAIADFGCGTGDFLNALAFKNKQHQLLGLDQISRPASLASHINYQQVDFNNKLSIPSNSFDLIISQHVLEHLTIPLLYFSEMVRSLKPGGFLLIEAPSDRSAWLSFPRNQYLNTILSFYDDPTHVGRPWTPQAFYRLALYHQLDFLAAEYDSNWKSKITLPFSFLKFLKDKNTDKFVSDYWSAIGWCCFAVLRKTTHSSPDMTYFSLKGKPHGGSESHR